MKRAIAAIITIATIIATTPITAVASNIPDDGVLVITKDASDDGKQLDKRINQYNALPECIRGVFKANGATIQLTSPTEVSDSNKYMGWTYNTRYERQSDGSCKTTRYAISYIYLVSREKEDASTLLHESGHLVDSFYKGGWPATNQNWNVSTTAEWQDLYSRYKTTISKLASTGPKNVYDASEAWAETFMNVCLDPEKVKTKAPELYDYTRSIIDSFTEYGDTSLPREQQTAAAVQEPEPVVENPPVDQTPTETVTERETAVETPEQQETAIDEKPQQISETAIELKWEDQFRALLETIKPSKPVTFYATKE